MVRKLIVAAASIIALLSVLFPVLVSPWWCFLTVPLLALAGLG
jgi:hypothetical protein